MPTYEYRCTHCGHRFDIFQRIDEEHLRTCERCGGELRKVFHPAGIVFKGSGFYATDSRPSAKTSESSGSTGSSDGGDASKKPAETGTSTSSEKKGEKKGEQKSEQKKAADSS